jgi:hypothetical protein
MYNNLQNESALRVPQDVYRPYKRCEFCQSVYLTDNLCEACGRSVRFDLLGPAFGYKSFYGIKERYQNSLPSAIQSYPIFENIKSDQAKSFIRKLQKRLENIASTLAIFTDTKKIFVSEGCAIIHELLFYGVAAEAIIISLHNNVELEKSLLESSLVISSKQSWYTEILSYRLGGILRVKFVLITCTLTMIFLLGIAFSLRSGR